MKFYYAGLNIYGQITNSTQNVINSFCENVHENAEDIEMGQFCLVMHCKDGVFLSGAANMKVKQSVELKTQKSIVQMHVDDEKIMYLTADGTLWKILLEDVHCTTELPDFIHLECDKSGDQVVKFVSNSTMNIFLTKQSKLFSLSSLINFENDEICDICGGLEHCLVLDQLGNVYSFGQGSRGQLGHGHLESEPNPTQILALGGIKITQIAAGGWHSCALSKDGDLYTWGWNSHGQLGLNTNEMNVAVMASPQVVEISTENDPDVIVKKVACGNKHTVILSDDNILYGMGWNKYNQLGIPSDQENHFTPILLKKFNKNHQFNVKCGPWCTVIYHV